MTRNYSLTIYHFMVYLTERLMELKKKKKVTCQNKRCGFWVKFWLKFSKADLDSIARNNCFETALTVGQKTNCIT